MNTTEKKLQAPLVHMNGTGEDTLLEDISNAYAAISDAMDALRKAAPDGRDYYPLETGSLKRAEDEHLARSLTLLNVKNELEALALAIQDGETEAVAEVQS